MNRYVSLVVAFLLGAAIVWVLKENRAEAPKTYDRSVDFTAEFTIQTGYRSVRTYRPHAVHVGGQRVFLSETTPDDSAEVTTIRFHNGHTQVAAVDVTGQ
jgi:hypothetical protein